MAVAPSAMMPPLVNWSAPQFFNPPHGVFTSDASFGKPLAKVARTVATFIPIAPCRLVDTRGAFNPAIASPGPFTVSTPTESRSYQATGNCGIPTAPGSVSAVSVAVTTLPTSLAGDVEVIPANAIPGKTVLMVMAASEWNSGTTVTPLDSTGKFQVVVRYSTPNPTDMAIDVNGYYMALDPSHAGDYFSIIGDAATAGKGLLDVVQTGPTGAAIRGTGGSGSDVRLAENTSAIDVVKGEVHATGAGIGTNTFAFLHQTTGGVTGNICDGTSGLDSHYTRLGTATQAFDALAPFADLSGLMLFVQQRGPGVTKPVQTIYAAGLHCVSGDAAGNGWYLFNNSTAFVAGENYAVMVIFP
jgi:hypothetical protein